MLRFVQKCPHNTRVSPGNAEWELTTFSDHVFLIRTWETLALPNSMNRILIPFLLILRNKPQLILSRLPFPQTRTDTEMQTDTEHLGARKKEKRREVNVATLQKNCSGQRVWRFGVWPQKESQEQSQEGCLRSRLPHAHRNCPFYPRVPCPTKGHLGGGQELLLRERLGPGSFESLGPQLLGVCVDPGASVKDSQCHQE